MVRSLEYDTFASQPSCFVSAGGIMVSPMNDAAAFVPLVLTVEFDAIAFGQRLDSRREIDVMGDEYGLTR